jgi:hypothetical protein
MTQRNFIVVLLDVDEIHVISITPNVMSQTHDAAAAKWLEMQGEENLEHYEGCKIAVAPDHDFAGDNNGVVHYIIAPPVRTWTVTRTVR